MAAARRVPKSTTPSARSTTARLEQYRSKRDFGVTSEPAGTAPPAPDGRRFVVQRHRASRLHYDVRLEAAGVLVSWAVPKGPTLDPDVRRLAVHVEDHPLDYFDFEGVIPAGEYGGGDVVVWDWGTWSLAEAEDALRAIDAGNLHFDLAGEKLNGRFVLVRTRGKGRDWLLLKKHDDDAQSGWDPEDHPRSVKSGRTNDEAKQAPAASWTGSAGWAPPTAAELGALDDLGTHGSWRLGEHTLRLTNLDNVVFPKLGGGPAFTKRDVIRHHSTVAPLMLPYVAQRPVIMHRFANGVDKPGSWHRAAPAHAPQWLQRWSNDDVDPNATTQYLVLDSPAAVAWAANHGAVELHPWTSTIGAPTEPSWALIDIDPGTASTFDDVLVLARLHRTAFEHLGVSAGPQVTGRRGIQIWIPVADGRTFTQTRTWVEQLSRAIGATVAEMVSWPSAVGGRGDHTRLDSTQNAIGKTLVAPFSPRAAPGAPVSVPITWDELDDPHLAPDRWTIDTIAERIRRVGDPLAPLIGLQQRLPSL